MSRASRMLSTTGFVAFQLAPPCRAGREDANYASATNQAVFPHRPDQPLEPIESWIMRMRRMTWIKALRNACCLDPCYPCNPCRQVCGLRLAVTLPLRSRSALHPGPLPRWLAGCASVESLSLSTPLKLTPDVLLKR